MTRGNVTFSVNGKRTTVREVPEDERLLDTLRWRLGLKGTKEGCRTGGCGACTILVDDRPGLSCLLLTHEVAGGRVMTVEGVHQDAVGRKVQAAFAAETALQCGYCTPGFVMATVAALKTSDGPNSRDQVLDDLQGNLCRCTGYASIRRAVERLTEAEP
jgi:aerobic-type carbon monoxide dehydrogenase small subunit (CoxS/CutS family)